MIYLVTGTPGAGKTLYAVSTLIQSLASQSVTLNDGATRQRRLVVDGIPGLLLPHELMAPGVEGGDGVLSPGEGDGLWNWFDWCVPGDVIVVDEVQRWWRPRGMGTKPPKMIQALETHRHKGVDFVLITQNPMLIDQNVRRLVGRHQHIRRLFGWSRAAVYEWDGCSMDVHRTASATMSYFGYPKSAYSLYKSSELHVKQKHKVPAWLALPVLAVVAGIVVAPTAFSTMRGAMSGKGIAQSTPSASSGASPPPLSPSSSPGVSIPPASSVAEAVDPPASSSSDSRPSDVDFSGCVYSSSRGCSCYSTSGKRVPVDDDMCQDMRVTRKPLASGWLPADTYPTSSTHRFISAEQGGPIHGGGYGQQAHAEPVALPALPLSEVGR